MGDYFVIDNSVVMSCCFKDEANKYADAVMDKLMVFTALVPSIWPLEVSNVLLVAERLKRISLAECKRFMTLLRELPIEIEQDNPERIMQDVFFLAREQKLSSYDASYLDLAMRNGLPLATLDKNLRAAAKRTRVPILF